MLPFSLRTLFTLYVLLIGKCLYASATNDCPLHKVDYTNGLSHSAVLCQFKDNNDLMWFGTYDGLNCWDSRTMDVFRVDPSYINSTLSNNVVADITQADSCCLWITTGLGLCRFSQQSLQIVNTFPYQDNYKVLSNRKGNTWLLENGKISYYNTLYRSFITLNTPNLPKTDLNKLSFATEDGTLWIASRKSGKIYRCALPSFSSDSLDTRLQVATKEFHNKGIEKIFYQNGMLCFIDCDKDLYIFDFAHNSKIYLRNIEGLEKKYGEISGITPFGEDIMIAFLTNGLVRLCGSQKYEAKLVNQNIRIYSLYRDPNQHILWIASDGQGSVIYTKKSMQNTNIILNRISPNLSRQVRSIRTTQSGDVWMGTKGNGLLRLSGIGHSDTETPEKAVVYDIGRKQDGKSYVKGFDEFQVYCLSQSRFTDKLWIGSGNTGLCYYSLSKDLVQSVKNETNVTLNEIHGIYEKNDSILYLTSSTDGFSKIHIAETPQGLSVKRAKRYRFFYRQEEIRSFYPLLSIGDSALWLGSRGQGLVRFNVQTGKYYVFSLKELLNKQVDDVLSLHYAKNKKLYAGTSSGLVELTFHGNKMIGNYIGKEHGLLNDMIHGILEDDNGILWLSTNRGVTKYNPANGILHNYYYSNNIQIGEFCDDAYYKCPYTGKLYFGGTNGLICLTPPQQSDTNESCPDIRLRHLWIGKNNRTCPITCTTTGRL